MQKIMLMDLKLDLFDGAAAAAGGTGGGEGQGANQTGPASARRGQNTGGQVLYGRQEPAAAGAQAGDQPEGASAGGSGPKTAGEQPQAQVQTTSDTLEARKKAYAQLVNGEYKDLYDKDVQGIVKRRVAEAGALKEQLGQYQPVMDLLMQRYGVDDVGKLTKALESDEAYWTQAAEEAGMSVEQYKQFQRLQRENAALLRQQRQRQGEERANAQLLRWNEEARQAQALYPRLDLTAECQDPQFLAMLKAGVPVQHAYEVTHMEEIKAGVAAIQARATEKQVVDGIRARGARPQENGTAAQSGFVVKNDVHQLTRKDRAEIARRAARGERISF